MPIHNPILPLAGWGLLVLGATSYPNNSAAETKPALQIEHDAVNDEVNLSFEASQTDRYYLLEGRSSLDDLTGTDWRVGYGVKGDGTPRKTPMPMPTDTGFYRLLQVDQDSPRLQIDYDGDRVTALEELNRGLDAFEQSPDDRDGDFIPSDFEVIYGLNPQDPSDALLDADRDGINNVNEYWRGDDPHTEEADRFTLSVYVEKKVLDSGCTYIQETSPLYSYRHQTGLAHTSGHSFYNLLSDCGSRSDRNESNIDTICWERYRFKSSYAEEYLSGRYTKVFIESGFYRIFNCAGPPMTFLFEHCKYKLVESRENEWRSTVSTENTETIYEVAHWDGRQLTIDGAPVALPTGQRDCRYTYGHVELPYWVDLDILHPASGRLGEELEDKDYDSSGGYVALKREIDGEDVAPVTQLQLRRCSHYEMEHYRLKFDSGGRYRIYSDANRTQEIISEQTEFTAGTETTVYLQGLSVSDSLGGEEVTLQVGLSGNWYATDSVNFTVVQAEFEEVEGTDDFGSLKLSGSINPGLSFGRLKLIRIDDDSETALDTIEGYSGGDFEFTINQSDEILRLDSLGRILSSNNFELKVSLEKNSHIIAESVVPVEISTVQTSGSDTYSYWYGDQNSGGAALIRVFFPMRLDETYVSVKYGDLVHIGRTNYLYRSYFESNFVGAGPGFGQPTINVGHRYVGTEEEYPIGMTVPSAIVGPNTQPFEARTNKWIDEDYMSELSHGEGLVNLTFSNMNGPVPWIPPLDRTVESPDQGF